MKQQKWNVTPYVGVGPLKLGMSFGDVAKFNGLIGEPVVHEGDLHALFSRSPPDALTEQGFDFSKMEEPITEVRATVLCDYFGGKLSAITLRADGEVAVSLIEIDFFNTDTLQLLQVLERKNQGAQVGPSGVFFDKLSVMLDNYYWPNLHSFFKYGSEEQDDRSVGIYSQDAFARLLAIPIIRFNPVTFLAETK